MIDIIKKPAILVIFLCSLNPLAAQKKSFNEGYIIEHVGDTIWGLVKDRSAEPFVTLYNKIRFKRDGRSRTSKYTPDDIVGYGYQDQHFVTMPIREESAFFKFRYHTDANAPRVFLKRIEQSKGLIYFEQLFVHDDNDYLDFIPLFYRPGRSDLVRVTQGIFGFRKKRLMAYFYDCPALITEINKPNSNVRTVDELYKFCTANCKL